MTQPVVRLKALTFKAKRVLGGPYLEIKKFPFYVGRKSHRTSMIFPWSKKNHTDLARPDNDLNIREPSQTHHISREHFFIDLRDDGLFLVDQGSICGTIVQDKKIGGSRTRGECPLRDHDVVRVGLPTSPYVFEVLIEPGIEGQKPDEKRVRDEESERAGESENQRTEEY